MNLRAAVVAASLGVCGCAALAGPDPTQSGFKLSGTSAVADGKQTITVEASLLDSKDAPVAGATITVKVSGSGNEIGNVTLSDKTGHAKATIASTVAETKKVDVLVVSFLDGTLQPVSTTNTTVSFHAGPPAGLGFDTQPKSGAAGAPLAAVKVGVFDANGNSLGSADPGTPVSLILYGGTPGATLGGTTMQSSNVGDATFSDLTVSTAGTGYRLVATSNGLDVAGVSQPFDIN